MRFVPSTPTTRPSGVLPEGAVYAYPEIARHPADVGTYQRILMGLGFDVGPQRADGQLGAATAGAVARFQRWYNGEPALGRGPDLIVDGLLGPETQRALNRYAPRQANAPVGQVPVVVSPARPAAPPMAGSTPVPATWGRSFLDPTITLGTTTQGGTSPWVVVGAVTALVGASLAVANYLQTRRSARR